MVSNNLGMDTSFRRYIFPGPLPFGSLKFSSTTHHNSWHSTLRGIIEYVEMIRDFDSLCHNKTYTLCHQTGSSHSAALGGKYMEIRGARKRESGAKAGTLIIRESPVPPGFPNRLYLKFVSL